MRAVRWLGATAIHSKDHLLERTMASFVELTTNYQQLGIIVNLFDAKKVDAPRIISRHAGPSSSQLEGTWVPGMKTLFWKVVLTPARTRGLELVWLFDCDIAVHPSVFPLGQMVGTLKATRATLIQPSVRGWLHGTYHGWLRARQSHMSCLATTAQFVEMQTPMFAGEAWARFNEVVLSEVPNEGLAASGYGIDISWCAAMRDFFPSRPTCLVTPAEAAIHLNSHTIEKFKGTFANQTYKAHTERFCHTTCKVIQRRFKGYIQNYSHHNGRCYGLSGVGGMGAGLRYEGGHYSLLGGDTWSGAGAHVTARKTSAAERLTWRGEVVIDGAEEVEQQRQYSEAMQENTGPASLPATIVGATTLPGTHAKRKGEVVGALVALTAALPYVGEVDLGPRPKLTHGGGHLSTGTCAA
jgi:hypothetical protein